MMLQNQSRVEEYLKAVKNNAPEAETLHDMIMKDASDYLIENGNILDQSKDVEQNVIHKRTKSISRDYKLLIGYHRAAKDITKEIGRIKRAVIKHMRQTQ